jgi:hypothetical protein
MNRMRMLLEVLPSLCLVLLLLIPTNVFAAGVVAYPLQSQVTLDARYTTTAEWNDAKEYSIEAASGPLLYYSMKYDTGYLYFMWDFVECTKPFSGNSTGYSNQVYIVLNPENKGTLDPTMYAVWSSGTYVSYARGTSSAEWTAEEPAPVDIQSRTQYTSSPHSISPHMIVEMRVALTFADLKSHLNGAIGFALGALDGFHGRAAEYPRGWRNTNPSTWGTLEFSQTPIPEFPSLVLALLVPFMIVIVAGKLSKKQARPQ